MRSGDVTTRYIVTWSALRSCRARGLARRRVPYRLPAERRTNTRLLRQYRGLAGGWHMAILAAVLGHISNPECKL
jgi:hypothetical protein